MAMYSIQGNELVIRIPLQDKALLRYSRKRVMLASTHGANTFKFLGSDVILKANVRVWIQLPESIGAVLSSQEFKLATAILEERGVNGNKWISKK